MFAYAYLEGFVGSFFYNGIIVARVSRRCDKAVFPRRFLSTRLHQHAGHSANAYCDVLSLSLCLSRDTGIFQRLESR